MIYEEPLCRACLAPFADGPTASGLCLRCMYPRKPHTNFSGWISPTGVHIPYYRTHTDTLRLVLGSTPDVALQHGYAWVRDDGPAGRISVELRPEKMAMVERFFARWAPDRVVVFQLVGPRGGIVETVYGFCWRHPSRPAVVSGQCADCQLRR